MRLRASVAMLRSRLAKLVTKSMWCGRSTAPNDLAGAELRGRMSQPYSRAGLSILVDEDDPRALECALNPRHFAQALRLPCLGGP